MASLLDRFRHRNVEKAPSLHPTTPVAEVPPAESGGERPGRVPVVDFAAIAAMRQSGDVEGLIRVLDDKAVVGDLRGSAALALTSFTDSQAALEAVLRAIYDPDPAVKGAAVTSLEAYSHSEAAVVGSLIHALDDADEWVRREAARIAGGIGDERIVEPLKARLSDTSSDVRWNAANSLAYSPWGRRPDVQEALANYDSQP